MKRIFVSDDFEPIRVDAELEISISVEPSWLLLYYTNCELIAERSELIEGKVVKIFTFKKAGLNIDAQIGFQNTEARINFVWPNAFRNN